MDEEELQSLMLSISQPLRVKALNYYVRYYTTKMKKDGVWFGEGTEALGVRGQVEKEELRALMLGFDSSGAKPLVQNAGDEDRTAAWDLTFSAPKSVSVLWALLPEAERKIIELAQVEAVKTALAFLQEHAAFSRRGKAGAELDRGKLVCALFEDYTSRELDPSLHTHSLLINLAVRGDGTTGSIRSKNFFEFKMAVGAVYRVDLASRLQKELGVEIEPDRFAFRIKDVPYRVCREFSKRRLQIEAELKRMGASDAVSASAATQKTRGPAREAKMESLFAAWQKVGEELGFGPREAKRLLHQVTQSHEEKTQEREEQTTGPEQKSTSAENGRKFEEASRSSTKDEFRAKVKEAEQEAYKDLSSKKNFFGLVSQLFPQPYHVRHFEVFIWNKPSVKHGVVVPRKPLLKIPYLVLGPKPQHWGKIRQRILTDKDGELRWQEKILFPKIPGLRGFTEARLRWYRYTKEEKLEAALERERKSHEATKQELNQERKVKAEKQREETEHRRREDERRREEELRRSREQSRSCR